MRDSTAKGDRMVYIHFALLFACIIYAAKLGGIGVGMAGGFGMAIAVFCPGIPPGPTPLDVILIIMSVLFACSVMHVAGGMDYMVRVASRVLRANPKYINILAPAIAFLLTILSGTGFTTMSILNVIQEVAKQNGVRPSQPLTSAVVASQIAISASPISAATAAMWVVVETMAVSFGQVLCVILPAGLFGAAVASLISAFQGVDLEKDPIFQARMKAGLVAMSSQEQREAPLPKGAKLSVVIFLLSVVFIVAMLLFKKEIGHTLGSRDIIVITMLFISMLMYWFCDVELTKIKNSSIFKGGYESLVVILGICWRKIGEVVLHAKGIKNKSGINVDEIVVHKGEIVGMAGLVGAGRTESMRILIGADKGKIDELTLFDKQVKQFKNVHSSIENGVVYMTEDRKADGLALTLNVEKNISIASLKKLSRRGLVSEKKAEENANTYVEKLQIKISGLEQQTKLLSGGNQQKVILAKWMSCNPRILIFDEPTKGIDVGAKFEIYKLMNQLSDAGLGIILISSDLSEVIGMSDRVYVYREGHTVGELSHAEIEASNIMQYATGIKKQEGR